MLIDARTAPEAVLDEPGLRRVRSGPLTLLWKGHMHREDGSGGEAAALALARALAERPPGALAAQAGATMGVFGLFVHDARDGSWRACSDPSGMYKLFSDGERISTGFLALAGAGGARGLDVANAVEYLAHGGVFGTATVVAGIGRVDAGEVAALSPAAPAVAFEAKELPDPREDARERLLAYADGLARSLSGRSVSVDVTGGFDSRLVVCLLAKAGAAFEVAVTGPDGSADVETAREVAAILGRRFEAFAQDLGNLDAEIAQAFEAGDGITDVRRFHRDHRHALTRRSRGVEVLAHGGGGEFFKDFYALQDFPFYGRKKSNLGRFYDLRVQAVPLPRDQLAPAGRDALDGLRARTIAKMEAERRPTNNETYAWMFYRFRAVDHFGQFYSNYVNLGLDVAAPFLDRRNARAGTRLPPWSMFFNRFHRELLTERCPELAALKTTDGYPALATWRALPGNLKGYTAMQARRAAKKASQKLVGKAKFHTVGAFLADDPRFIPALQASPRFADAVARLQDLGVLAPGLEPSAVRPVHVGRVLTLGMLAERLGRAEAPAAAPAPRGAG